MPATPTPLAPDEGTEIDDPSVTFEWTGVDEASNYELQLARDQAFEDLVFEGRVGDTTAFSYSGLPAQEGIRLFWRVRARMDGTWSDFSDAADFVVADWQPEQPAVAQATSDEAPVSEASESITGPVLMTGVVVLTIVAMGWLFARYGGNPGASAGRATASTPAPDTADTDLRRYDVVDEEQGVYRIPIDSAMKEVVESRGGEWEK